MIWSQARSQFPTLQISRETPGSTAGVERQQKVVKRVHIAVRNRTGGGMSKSKLRLHTTPSSRSFSGMTSGSSLRSG
ncbi:hypothetical protein PC116_g11766 [Phytophthora cactorum]|nr:hypothetical protein PC116_g11766 [Phytophthora cactorum]